MSLVKFLCYLEAVSPLLPFIMGFHTLRKPNHPLKLFTILLGIWCFNELFGALLAINGINNLWSVNLDSIYECIIFIRIFSNWLELPNSRKLFYFLSAGWVSAWLLTSIHQGTLMKINDTAFHIESLILISLSGFCLYKLSQQPTDLFSNPKFWIASSVLFSYATQISYTAFADQMWAEGGEWAIPIQSIFALSLIISNIIYAIGLKCSWEKVK